MARILVVDDDAMILDMVKDIIIGYAKTEYKSEWELKIHTTTDSVQALSMVTENNYELIITDILMAKLDGWTMIKEIRKRFPEFHAPIIVMSAVQGIDLEYESMKNGASAWFTKPIHPREFAKKVFELIKER